MRNTPTLLLAVVLLLGDDAVAEAQQPQCPSGRNRIVGGEAARLENWPGQAAFRIRSASAKTEAYFCGGTAVSDRWVLSAAHCFEDYLKQLPSGQFDSTPTTRDLEVVLGSVDLTKTITGNAFRVERIIVHEGYRYNTLHGDDIALVRLANPWTGPVATLSLGADSDPPQGNQVRVAG